MARRTSSTAAPRRSQSEARSPLVKQVLDQVKDALYGLSTGQPLPTEIVLARQFGVSRKTLRAAMWHLERDGVVQRIPGRGTFPKRGKVARALFRSQAGQLGLVSWTGAENALKASSDFYPQILEGAAQEALTRGCHIVLSGGRSDSEREEACYRLEDLARVEGLILVALTDQALLEDLARRGKPVCLVDHFSERARVDCVRVDSSGGSRLALEHLFTLGHRDIAFINTEPGSVNPSRLRGYEEFLRERGLPRRAEWIVSGEGVRGGAEAAMRLMAVKDRPTAILAFSDAQALGAMQALLRFGLRVPEDLSIVGTSGLESPVTVGLPALTCVRFDSAELGRTAVRFLLERIADPKLPPRQTQLLGTLDLAASTAPPGGKR